MAHIAILNLDNITLEDIRKAAEACGLKMAEDVPAAADSVPPLAQAMALLESFVELSDEMRPYIDGETVPDLDLLCRKVDQLKAELAGPS